MSNEKNDGNSNGNEVAEIEKENVVGDSQKTNAESQAKTTTEKKPEKKTRTRRRGKRTKAKGKTTNSPKTTKRIFRSFPASTFEDALPLAQAIQQFASGQKVRRLTLFDYLKKSPDSSDSRQLMTNSSRYGLTTGSKTSEYLELTLDGKIATSSEVDERQKTKARFKLAIENILPFNDLYEHLKSNKLPAKAVLRDFLLEKGYTPEEVSECVDTFIVNAKYLGLLKPIAGSERLLPMEHVLEEVAKLNPTSSTFETNGNGSMSTASDIPVTSEGAEDWSNICFYITPIGEAGSEQRSHSDLFLSSIVEPALEEFGLKVVRADQIGQPGLITSQIIEHIIKSRLAIADLSFHNANVFYELCLRHAFRLPTVQIIRVGDKIPFDVSQVRTIQIDNTSIYTLVPQLETFKSEIANQVRRALSNPESVDNPLTIFYPNLGVIQPT